MDLLKGIRVLDLTSLYPGPFCTMLMADMGADVIKVEMPGNGDHMRQMGPMDGEDSCYFKQLNRNKKSLTINLKQQLGVKIFLDLATKADVVIEGFRPGVVDTLGIGYDAVKKVNTKIIYCSISGYGQSGPYRDRAGHDINYLALAGGLDLTGCENGSPVLPGLQIADVGGGALMALVSVLASLYDRKCNNKGRYIDVAMLDGTVSWLTLPLADFFTGKYATRGHLMLNGGRACYGIYRTSCGGYMALGALENKFWTEFCRAVGRDDLIDRHSQPDQDILKKEVQKIFASRSRKEWEEIFSEYDACCEPVLSLEEMMKHPQIKSRGIIEDKTISFPVKIAGTEFSSHQAPTIGRDTYQILMDLGYTEAVMNELSKRDVI